MNDHVTRIDQHPISVRHALDAGGPAGQALGLLGHMFGESRHVPSGTPGCDDHEIGEGRFALKVDEGEIFSLVVLEGFRKRFCEPPDVFQRSVPDGLNPVLGGWQDKDSSCV